MIKSRLLFSTFCVLLPAILFGLVAPAGAAAPAPASLNQIVLGAPDWSFGPNVTPDTSTYDHRRMVVSDGCDVNGDGYDDILVGRRDFTISSTAHAGRVWLFMGGPGGLSPTPSLVIDPPAITTYGFFGTVVSCAGDVNGDGKEDVIIGMDNYDSSNSDEGAVFVYHGAAPLPSATYTWMARGNSTYAHFGESVDGAGDVNGDGFDDIIVGAKNLYSYSNRDVYVWLGSSGGLGASGLPTNADWYASTPYADEGPTASVRGIGDVNGDGFDDILAGASRYDGGLTDQGAVYVWYGAGGGLGDPGTSANADWSAVSGQASGYFGYGADGIGDVNGDGFADIAVGAYGYDNPETTEGKVFVWHGSASGLGDPGTAANADWSAETDVAGSSLGYVVRAAGDMNGDGYADLLVTAYNYSSVISQGGAWFVWNGSASGLGENGTPANADVAQYCNQATAFSGRDDAGAGDVNGDFLSDIFVVAFRYDDPEVDEGVASGWYSTYQRLFLPLVATE